MRELAILGRWPWSPRSGRRLERAKTFRLTLTTPAVRLAGQYYVVRLTAPDGYTASRSYSVASAPSDSGEIELTVERLEGGEVSEFLHDEVMVGDELEVRGPIGLWFVWEAETPAILVGGGSGVVPLMAMLRLARQSGRSDLLRMAVSVRTPDDLYYAHELPGPETTVAYTRVVPPSSTRPPGRLSEHGSCSSVASWSDRLRMRLARLRRLREWAAPWSRSTRGQDPG